MSTIANQVVNGFLCQVCIGYMEGYKEPGYPRTCEDCKEDKKREKRLAKYKKRDN